MAPRGSSCMSRPRRAASVSASSRLNTPPMQAAAISPTLCPIMAAGSTPQLGQQASQRELHAEDGRLADARLQDALIGGRIVQVVAEEQLREAVSVELAERLAAHSSMAALKTGSLRYRPAPIRAYWAPWPVNRKATRAPVCAVVCSALARGSSSRRRATAESVSYATIARRWGIRARPTASV